METNERDKIKKFKVVKKKKKKSKLPMVLFIIILIIVGVVLLFKLPYFNVGKFIVEGNSFYTEEQIIEASGIDTN